MQEQRLVDHAAAQWEALGANDPLYGVMSLPDKRGGAWDVEAFFATGAAEVEGALGALTAAGLAPLGGVALDFGCGVGRLSKPLAARFERVLAVDAAPSMLEQARRFDRSGGRIEWILNQRPDLAFVPDASVDLVYTTNVLQHLPPALILAYLAEFMRVLKPGGVASFQVPLKAQDAWRRRFKALTPRWALRAYRRARYGPQALVDVEVEMNGVPEAQVRRAVEAAGGRLVKAAGSFYWAVPQRSEHAPG